MTASVGHIFVVKNRKARTAHYFALLAAHGVRGCVSGRRMPAHMSRTECRRDIPLSRSLERFQSRSRALKFTAEKVSLFRRRRQLNAKIRMRTVNRSSLGALWAARNLDQVHIIVTRVPRQMLSDSAKVMHISSRRGDGSEHVNETIACNGTGSRRVQNTLFARRNYLCDRLEC